ncbi:LysR family transcriptional regulator [Rhizobium leguminosarum]|uniref:LysR family transcriptional regulator n=1 Tax=Rhizobium TaxID=379 RepID=UPI00147946EB|nr:MULTISPECIES: LysR family transcriptional regulator [Rhizobium]MBY5355042.1 LysR family transcriptional regulator [Rhizobium leguminosarum]MBY5454608.1 LysR family transcriptional regulator [Rhizobium leguminosarum]NNH41073.1 LysR family transcriptional regulator [Rhizobium laguerreae]NNH55793.1 LysR family transcriptional regulator [Rhizobium laguerreae]
MDHKLMQSFVAVAEELHFGRAAARLHISQPPLTKQIQQLEKAMGVRLLERTKRKVELTAAGRVFLDEARAVLYQTGQAVELARKAERGETGHLSVGFIDAAIYSVVPAIVQRFTARYPDIELSLTDLRIPNQIKMVTERRLDIGFVHPPVNQKGLQVESILVEPLIVALPETHRLSRETEIALADLAHEALIQFPRSINPSLYDEIVGLCRSSGFSPRIMREATPKQTIIGLVSVGLGVSLLPACLENLRRPGVVYRPIQGRNLTIDTSIIYRREQPSPVLGAFLNIVRETAGMETTPHAQR